jgi:ceramide glucosyltransferase
MAWTAMRDALLIIAVAPLAYYLVATIAGERFFRAKAGQSFASGSGSAPDGARDFSPAVSILKPIHGLDRDTYENYASFCRQDYPEYEIIFCVSDEVDPATEVIRKVIADFPQRAIRLLIGAPAIGASDKVNKLCRMAREAQYEILVVSDSDVRVDPGHLRALVAPFRDAQVGGVTCLYYGLTDGSFAADMEALGNSTDFAPGVLVAWLGSGGKRSVDFMLGATMATTKARLAEIGGFEALADYFCDDYELGNRIAARGHRVELSAQPVAIVYPRQTLGDAFRHQLRWNLSIRYSRPWGHAGLIFTHGLPWMILGVALAQSDLLAWVYVAGYSLLRYEMALTVGARGMRDPLVRKTIWMLPVRDAFAFVVWVASFFSQRIHWRGRQFRVREKRLVAADERSGRA